MSNKIWIETSVSDYQPMGVGNDSYGNKLILSDFIFLDSTTVDKNDHVIHRIKTMTEDGKIHTIWAYEVCELGSNYDDHVLNRRGWIFDMIKNAIVHRCPLVSIIELDEQHKRISNHGLKE